MTALKRLKNILREHNAEFCTCGNEIGFGDIAWNEGNTSEGTPTSWVQIECVNCQREVAWVNSWTLFSEEDEEHNTVLRILEQDWKI